MIRFWTIIFLLLAASGKAQVYDESQVFAHNDYVRADPFYTAYNLRVGYIEADVFLDEGEISVAHDKHEIADGKTLEALYLKPLLKQIRKNEGRIYESPDQTLMLMIDLKTEGVVTLNAIVSQLKKYPELLGCSTLHFMISGNVPDPKIWENYPAYIKFDGRPGIPYTEAQLERIAMISTSFGAHAKWNGMGKIPEGERRKILALIDEVHSKGKKIRFWATPDFENAWRELMLLKPDVIVTDDVTALVAFLNLKK